MHYGVAATLACMMRGLPSWVLASSLGVVACDSPDDREDTRRPEPAIERARGLDAEATRMLAHVPADTPYVWFNAEPLPQAYVDRIAPLVDATLAAWGRELDRPHAIDDPEVAALVDAFRGRMSRKGLEALGFAINPRVIVYGLGLAPVVRLELRDGNAVARLLEHADAADGRIEVRSIDGHPVWTTGSSRDSVAAAVAVVDDELVITVYPPAVEALILPLAIGTAPPRESLVRTDWLRDARRDHGLLPHGLGMVDLSRIVALTAGEGDALGRAVTHAWGATLDDDGCAPGLQAWAERAPRVWFGLREIGARGIATAMIWQLDDGLRDDLRGIVAPIAGLGRDEGLASLGIGIDAPAAIATLDRWRRDERLRGCDGYADPREPAVPVPTWLDGVHGGSAVLRDWEPARERASGVIVVGVDDPLAWLRAVMPAADTGPLRRRGHVVPLTKVLGAAGGAWLSDAWIARGRHALGIATGDGARRGLRRAVGNDRDDRHTLVSWSLDVQGLLDLIPAAEMRASLDRRDPIERAAVEAMLDALGPIHGALAVGDHGLELTSELALQR